MIYRLCLIYFRLSWCDLQIGNKLPLWNKFGLDVCYKALLQLSITRVTLYDIIYHLLTGSFFYSCYALIKVNKWYSVKEGGATMFIIAS
jgi:hypothetical protein